MKDQILGTVADLVRDFLYYDRKDDEDLPLEDLETAINDGVVTVDEMVAAFRKALEEGIADS